MNSRESDSLLGKKLKKERSNEENSAEDDNSNENEENGDYKNGRWEKNEHLKFLKGCLLHGNNWKKVKEFVKTRSSAQIRSHAQKYIIKLCKKYKLKDSKQFRNLKDLRKNIRNEFLNNLSLNLNRNREDLSDLLELETETIEEKILCIFKSCGNLSEKRDDNLENNEDSNNSISNDASNFIANKCNKINAKGKIFGTAKIENKFETNEFDENEKNLLFRQNLDLKNLLLGINKNFEMLSQQRLLGKSPLENINPKELGLLLSLINSETSNFNNPLNNQIINGNFNNSNNISNNNNEISAYDEFLKVLSNQTPNNISNINNNYLNFNNFYQNNNNNNFNVTNGLNNLNGMGNLMNLMNLGQNNIFQNLNPKAHNILNDLNLLNSIILENNAPNNNNNKTKSPNKEIEDLGKIKAQNNAKTNNDTIAKVNAQNLLKGKDLTNRNESLFSNLLSGANNNDNNINNNNNFFLNNNSMNHFPFNPMPQNFLNNPSLNIKDSLMTSTNNFHNYSRNISNNNNPNSNPNPKTNNNFIFNNINNNTSEEKTFEADQRNSNYNFNNNNNLITIDNNLNKLFTQPALNQQINSLLQNQSIDFNHLINIKSEEAQKSYDLLENKLKNNKPIGDSAFKNENDFTFKANLINDKKLKMLLAHHNSGNASLKNISNLQDLQNISQIYNIFTSNEQINKNKQNKDKEEIYSLKANFDSNKNNLINGLQNETLENKPDHSAVKIEENINKNSNNPNKIENDEASKENKLQELNSAFLLNILNSQQTSTSFEPAKIEDNKISNKKEIVKINEEEAVQEIINARNANDCLPNQINFLQNEALFNPLFLKYNETLTNQINNLRTNSNPIDDLILNNFNVNNNQSKALADLINFNQYANANARNISNNNDLMINNQNNFLNIENALINNLQLNQFQEQLNMNNINSFANSNENNISNINVGNDLNINKSNNDLDKLQEIFQEYLKNCAEPS